MQLQDSVARRPLSPTWVVAVAPMIYRGKSLPSDEEVSETNQRNKAISSSAITRAMADGQAGERQLLCVTVYMEIGGDTCICQNYFLCFQTHNHTHDYLNVAELVKDLSNVLSSVVGLNFI